MLTDGEEVNDLYTGDYYIQYDDNEDYVYDDLPSAGQLVVLGLSYAEYLYKRP